MFKLIIEIYKKIVFIENIRNLLRVKIAIDYLRLKFIKSFFLGKYEMAKNCQIRYLIKN